MFYLTLLYRQNPLLHTLLSEVWGILYTNSLRLLALLASTSLSEGAVAARRLGELPKKFLHQRLFHQFQFFKALLYGLLLLVYTLHKGGELILKRN